MPCSSGVGCAAVWWWCRRAERTAEPGAGRTTVCRRTRRVAPLPWPARDVPVTARARHPRADAADPGDRVPHEEAGMGPLRNGDLGIGGDGVPRGPVHEVPEAGVGADRRPCVEDRLRVDPDARPAGASNGGATRDPRRTIRIPAGRPRRPSGCWLLGADASATSSRHRPPTASTCSSGRRRSSGCSWTSRASSRSGLCVPAPFARGCGPARRRAVGPSPSGEREAPFEDPAPVARLPDRLERDGWLLLDHRSSQVRGKSTGSGSWATLDRIRSLLYAGGSHRSLSVTVGPPTSRVPCLGG